MMTGKIKNLLFDLGGVVISIEREQCVSRLKQLGMRDADDMIGLYAQTSAFGSLESGAISADEFHDEMRRHFSRHVTNEEIDGALNAFITGLPVQRLQALRQLRKRYGVYVLSNTNPIMFHSRIAQLFRAEGLEMADYFDGITTSFEAKACKPDKKIFDYAVATMGIRPEETMFFDDGQANVDAARGLGFNAELVEAGTEFMQTINRLGL